MTIIKIFFLNKIQLYLRKNQSGHTEIIAIMIRIFTMKNKTHQ